MKKKTGVFVLLASMMLLSGCRGSIDKNAQVPVTEFQRPVLDTITLLEVTDEVYETEDGKALEITKNLLEDTFEAMDGTTVLKMSIEFPQIENPDNNTEISEMNYMLLEHAEEYADAFERSAAVMSQKAYERAAEQGEDFEAYTFTSDFTITCNKNGILSIRENVESSIEQKTSDSLQIGTIYDLKAVRALEIRDIFLKTEAAVMNDAMTRLYQRVGMLPEGFSDSVGYYAGNEGIYFFFSQNPRIDQQSPEIAFDYDDDEEAFKAEFLKRVAEDSEA